MNRVAFKNPAGYGQHPAPKIHGRSGQPQLVPAGLNYIESIMAFTPKNEYFLLRERYEGRYKKRWGNKPLISGWIMVMSRDIISKNSLTKRQFSFKPWRTFFWGYGYIQIGEILAHCTPSGECFRAEDRLVPLPNSKAGSLPNRYGILIPTHGYPKRRMDKNYTLWPFISYKY